MKIKQFFFFDDGYDENKDDDDDDVCDPLSNSKYTFLYMESFFLLQTQRLFPILIQLGYIQSHYNNKNYKNETN